MFEQANLFYEQYKQFDLSALVTIDNLQPLSTNDIIVFSINQEPKSTLISEIFKFSQASEIIVVSHPGCHFCSRAVNDINIDSFLSEFLSKHTTWLIPPSTRWTIEKTVAWNKKFPMFEVKYINEYKDFPMIDYWGTPGFYFIKNGEVLDTIIGWPKEGRLKELKLLIKKHFSVNL